MRKLLLTFLLPVILLLSQQGAALHEIGHLADVVAGGPDASPGGPATRVAAQSAESGRHRLDDLQCQACLAFAHLAGVATMQVASPTLSSFGFHFAAVETPAFIAADAPVARSRGPPLSA